jgi:hypothetical protein
MSTLPGADPQSLVLNVAAIAEGMRAFRDNRSELMSYVAAVNSVPIGAQPIVSKGISLTYDPMEKKPALKRALQEAQYHANSMAGYAGILHTWASGGSKQIVGYIKPPLEAVLAILRTVPSGGVVSDAQARDISLQMNTAMVFTQIIAVSTRQISEGVHQFLTTLLIDHETLSNGATSLAASIPEVQRDISNAAQKYVLDPMMSGIGQAILQIGREIVGRIQAVVGVIDGARRGHEAMRGGVGALANAAETVRGKYEAAASAVGNADRATVSVVLRRLDLASAIASWEQFDEFFSTSGL